MNKGESIYSKIRKVTLLISIISLLFMCVAAFVGIGFIRGRAVNANEKLGVSAAGDSMQALELQMEESLLNLAKSMSDVSDEKLSAVAGFIEMISENASEIMSNPNNYSISEVDFPDAANAGVVVAQLRLGEDVELEGVREELNLIANVQDMLKAVCGNSDSVRSAYIGTESGISISADEDSDKKTNVYDPRARPWYMTAKEKDALIWTDVFEDNSGRGLSITCAKPYYDAGGVIRGVAGCGMQLGQLTEVVVGTRIGKTGRAFIMNEKAEMIISHMFERDADGNIIRENLLESGRIPVETVQKMLSGVSGIERATIDGVDSFIAFEPLDTLPWSVAIVMSVEEVIAPALASQEHIIDMKNEAVSGIDKIILIITLIFAAVLVIATVTVILITKKFAGRLADPIIELCRDAEIIGGGDLSHRLDVKTGDEIERLADTFNAMIDGIKQITAEKERIGAELNVATRIQASMLPCIFPAFPDRPEFDIYASMLPAKEVGGDFYDFFLIDENKLAVVMADVSGKGVPAALFMVIAKTLIKNNAQYGKSPKEVFETVNNLLCENNEADMFVTAFLGYLDIPTGVFTYVNAGHNPPLFGSAGGEFCWLPTKPGFVLAGMEDMVYKQDEIILNSGDTLYLYTDGVTEAVDRENRLFTEPRLLEVANNYRGCELKALLDSIKLEIDSFANGAEQADDITMLALKITGGQKV